MFICLWDHLQYCRPCHNDGECAPDLLETSSARCLLWGPEEGSFCATPCAGDFDCPGGALCQLQEVGDEEMSLCQPASEACECSGYAISVGASTSCELINEFGACVGERFCADDGLTMCDAIAATAEVCNGLDDDCDGDS